MSQEEDEPTRDEPTRRASASGSDEGVSPMNAARQDLVLQIKECEGMLRYMGEPHPARPRTVRRHRQLTLLLERWEEAQRMQQEMRTMMDRHK